MDDSDIIARILVYEGGYVDDPADCGGATNFGITSARYGEVRRLGRPATPAEVKAMTQAEAIAIYQQDYIVTPGFDGLTNGDLRMVVVDCGVLHGTGRAARWLQQAAGVTVEGIVGPATIAKANAANASALARDVIGQRMKFLGQLISGDPSQARFAAGWMARVADLLQYV